MMRGDLSIFERDPARLDPLLYAGAVIGGLFGSIPIIADPSVPPNSFELRSGEQRVRVRWPDEATELARWADDGGRVP